MLNLLQDDDDDDDGEEDDNVQTFNKNFAALSSNNPAGNQSKNEIQNYRSSRSNNSGSLTLPVNQTKGNKGPPPAPPVRGATAAGLQPPRPATMNRLKQSDSSFGLHSPDNLPLSLSTSDGEVEVY